MAEQDAELKALGNTIQKLRTERELTIEALAVKAKLHSIRLGEIERGESEAKILELAHLAKALGTTTESLCKQAKL